MDKILKFVRFQEGVSKRNNKPYCMLTLSDGIEAKIFSIDEKTVDKEFLASLERSDEVKVEFVGDPFEYLGGWVVVAIELA